MLQYLVDSKICCIFASVLEHNRVYQSLVCDKGNALCVFSVILHLRLKIYSIITE